MKLLIAVGGGGHFSAALAVINELPKDWEVTLVGRRYAFEADKTLSFEYQTSQKLGFNFIPLTTGRLQRKFSRHTLLSLLKTPAGLAQSVNLIKKIKPDVIVSFGGYVSLPICFAGKMLGIPIVIHEQILGAGLANKIVSKFADKVCISWNESEKFFPENKIVLTGNPIKKFPESSTKFPLPTPKLPLIYITGGSGGAHGINVLIEGCLDKLLEKYNVIHQTGDAKQFGDFDRLNNKRDSLSVELKERYIVTKFVDPSQVASILKESDLVISRSGINTVTELLYFGKPCLFIPLPHGQRNEQLTNAMFVKKIGIAEVADQNTLNSEELSRLIGHMFDTIDIYKKHAEEGKKLIHLDAAERIINVIANAQKKKTP